MVEIVSINSALDPDKALENAKGKYKKVLIIGYQDDEGAVINFNTTLATYQEINFLIDAFKFAMFNGDFE